MVFCGDIAIPFLDGIMFGAFPERLKGECWFGNLEGSLVSDRFVSDNGLLDRRIVFNTREAINELVHNIPFRAFGLANNHILDAAPLSVTKANLDDLGVDYVGAGESIQEASKELVLDDGGQGYVIVSCGWDLIKCKYATGGKEGVNPYRPKDLVKKAGELVKKYPGKRLIFFIHWNYELELYPQPMDRDLSHNLIDAGAFAVIGCHAHRVQPIEIYKGKPIVYGLGNFAFRQNTFMDERLRFPDFSYPEMAFEIKQDGSFEVHNFRYDERSNTVDYVSSERVEDSTAPFAQLGSQDYPDWFKANRYQRKALPVFSLEDNFVCNSMKRGFVRARVKGVDMLVKNERLFSLIKNLWITKEG